jgi:hypothetical protein
LRAKPRSNVFNINSDDIILSCNNVIQSISHLIHEFNTLSRQEKAEVIVLFENTYVEPILRELNKQNDKLEDVIIINDEEDFIMNIIYLLNDAQHALCTNPINGRETRLECHKKIVSFMNEYGVTDYICEQIRKGKK